MGESGRLNEGSASASHVRTGFKLGIRLNFRYRRTAARADSLTPASGRVRAIRCGVKSSPWERRAEKAGLKGSPRSSQRRRDFQKSLLQGSEETGGRASMARGRKKSISFFNPRYSAEGSDPPCSFEHMKKVAGQFFRGRDEKTPPGKKFLFPYPKSPETGFHELRREKVLNRGQTEIERPNST